MTTPIGYAKVSNIYIPIFDAIYASLNNSIDSYAVNASSIPTINLTENSNIKSYLGFAFETIDGSYISSVIPQYAADSPTIYSPVFLFKSVDYNGNLNLYGYAITTKPGTAVYLCESNVEESTVLGAVICRYSNTQPAFIMRPLPFTTSTAGAYIRGLDGGYITTLEQLRQVITIYDNRPSQAEFLGHKSSFQTAWNPSIGYVNTGLTYDLTYYLRVSESETIDPLTDVTVTFTSPGVDDPGTLATWADGKLTIGPNLKVIGFTITATANGYVDSEGNPLTDSIFVNVLDSVYNEGGTSIGGIGGGGSFTGPGGSWGNGIGPSPSTSVVGDLPNGSAEQDSSRTGLFTRYGMSASQLYAVGAALYVEDILANIGKEIMSFLWNSPSEALISLISYPFSVTELVGSTATNIKFGSLQLEVTGNALSGTFAQIDWGTIQLEEFWGNFLDYAPHTKIDLYLPWCTGTVPVDTHECLPGSITVKTNIELSKGTCIHNVFGNKGALIGTYSGTCGSQLPMTSLDTAGKALALVTAAAGTLVAGAAAGGAKSAGITAANTPPKTLGLSHSELISDQLARIKEAEAPYRKIQKGAQGTALASSIAAFRNPAHVVRNGSFSASGAGMGMQFPFIIISRPEQNIPDGYGHYYGYPSNVYTRLGAVSGYAEIGSIHLDGFSTATADELIEIESLLKEGVIF